MGAYKRIKIKKNNYTGLTWYIVTQDGTKYVREDGNLYENVEVKEGLPRGHFVDKSEAISAAIKYIKKHRS